MIVFVFSWAVSTVMTRLNMVPSEANPETQTTALIPLWDMCNHTNGEVISVLAFAISNRCLTY